MKEQSKNEAQLLPDCNIKCIHTTILMQIGSAFLFGFNKVATNFYIRCTDQGKKKTKNLFIGETMEHEGFFLCYICKLDFFF